MTIVKICGVRDAATLDVAIEAGADLVGFVLVASSPRAVAWRRALDLARDTIGRATPVLLVDGAAPPPGLLSGGVLDLMAVQLHGAETPGVVEDLRRRLGSAIIKAIGVRDAADLRLAHNFAAADLLLLDAKPPEGARRSGGHGAAFDWSLLETWSPPAPPADRRLPGPAWMLAGGLTPTNVADAIRRTQAPGVDVSSGVESAPGVKDAAKIRDFIQAAKAAGAIAG